MKRNVLFVVLFVALIFSVFGQSESDFRFREENGGITITGYRGNVNDVEDVVIPERINGLPVVAIGDNVFYYTRLTSVTLPNSLTTIGEMAFYDNPLTSITFPNSITSIGDSAFRDNQLTSITLPNSLTTIGSAAFANNQLTNITLPNSLTTIESSAFSNNRLTSITLPNSITTIKDWAFKNNQLKSITFSNSLTTIGRGSFEGNKLTSITLPNSLTTIGSEAFSINQLTSITFSNSLTTIDYWAFRSNKLTNVAVPTSVVKLASNAFDRNVRITRGQTPPPNPASPSNPMANEILNNTSKFAVLKCHTKTYIRDSYNATWFDRHKASGNPNITINRKRQDISIANGALKNEYWFETTFYNSNKNVVVSVDVSIQFIDSPVVYVIYIPYAQQNHYDRRRQVDEPSGKYALHEQSVPCDADDGAKAFIQFYEEASKRIITNFQ